MNPLMIRPSARWRTPLAADYVVLATGATCDRAEDTGCNFTENDVVDDDESMERSIADAYATDATVRAGEWDAVVSLHGDGQTGCGEDVTYELEEYHALVADGT